MLAGDACGDMSLTSIEEWLFLALFIFIVWAFYSDAKEKRERINWFTVYYPLTGKTIYSVWSVGWLKFWVGMAIILFIMGFYNRYLELST